MTDRQEHGPAEEDWMGTSLIKGIKSKPYAGSVSTKLQRVISKKKAMENSKRKEK